MDGMTESPSIEMGRPTLKTIAAETGLAIATVSRALKDAPDIGEATKRRVRETALRLGYRPNRAGVRLRTGKTNVIALVLSTEADMMNHTSRLIYSIAAELRGTAYHLVVMPFFADEDPMTPIRYLVETESADGLIINQTTADDPRVAYMIEQGFPFATHGRTSLNIDHPYFDYDNEEFARIAVRTLAARKHRNLMLIAPPAQQNYSRHMVKGFVEECAVLGLSAEILGSADSDSGAHRIEAEMTERFATHPAPDALVVGSTTAAMASVTGAERAGFQIGVDFDVVAKEAISFLKRFRKEIIVLHEDVNHAGEFLARAVIAAIERRAPEQGQFIETPTEAHLA
jgi:LacI family transcriptional regulator